MVEEETPGVSGIESSIGRGIVLGDKDLLEERVDDEMDNGNTEEVEWTPLAALLLAALVNGLRDTRWVSSSSAVGPMVRLLLCDKIVVPGVVAVERGDVEDLHLGLHNEIDLSTTSSQSCAM